MSVLIKFSKWQRMLSLNENLMDWCKESFWKSGKETVSDLKEKSFGVRQNVRCSIAVPVNNDRNSRSERRVEDVI